MDDRTFRNAMGKFATGVTVITTKVDEEIYGMTANAFMSVSLDPKLITISVDNKAKLKSRIQQSGHFAVSFLSEEQKEVSMHFAGQKKKDDEIEFDLINNVPAVKDALATVICDVQEVYVVGDHTLFIGAVNDINLRDGDPLTFYQGKYGTYQLMG